MQVHAGCGKDPKELELSRLAAETTKLPVRESNYDNLMLTGRARQLIMMQRL